MNFQAGFWELNTVFLQLKSLEFFLMEESFLFGFEFIWRQRLNFLDLSLVLISETGVVAFSMEERIEFAEGLCCSGIIPFTKNWVANIGDLLN